MPADELLHRPADLALYVRPMCGYCDDVRDAARALGVSLEERDTWGGAQHLRELVAARGRRTVPVLRIASASGPDRWLGESQDIIRYLETRFGSGRQTSRGPRLRAWMSALPWVLLVAGGVSEEPSRSALWTVACLVAALRSGLAALRSGARAHAWIAVAFALGAASNGLFALGVADVPWWYAAIAIAIVALADVGLRWSAG